MTITGAQVVALIAGIGTFVFVLELVRRRQLREKYAALWFILAVGMALLAFSPGMLDGLAEILDIRETASILFFTAILILLGVVIHLSWELSRLESETRALSEEIALLRLEVETQHPRPPSGPPA